MASRELRNAACSYADSGWAVMPLVPRTKRPLTPNGQNDASSDLVTVFKWWKRYPQANIGIVCDLSGIVVLDVDSDRAGQEDLRRLEGEWGALPATIEALSGNGGQHLIFRHPGCELVGKLPLDVEVKHRGIDLKNHGYIVAPPSIHPFTGRRYEWSVDGHPDEVKLAALPERWIEECVSNVTTRPITPRSPGQGKVHPLLLIPAAEYVARLTGRELQRGNVFTCPWHAGGDEWDPSLKVEGELWACHGCPPILGKRALGGNIFDMAGLLAGYAVPLRGADYLDVKARLERVFKL